MILIFQETLANKIKPRNKARKTSNNFIYCIVIKIRIEKSVKRPGKRQTLFFNDFNILLARVLWQVKYQIGKKKKKARKTSYTSTLYYLPTCHLF